MMTPFGPSVDGPFATKDDFYAAYPEVAEGWAWEAHGGTAPLGWDLRDSSSEGPNWLCIFCFPQVGDATMGPQPSTPGVVVAFDRSTGQIWVLDNPITFPAAQAKY